MQNAKSIRQVHAQRPLKSTGNHVTSQALQTLPEPVFDLVCKLAYDGFALKLDETKKSMVYRRLAPRVKELGLTCFEDYADLLLKDETERDGLMTMLTTNLTSFFRERHHFDLLQERFLPALIARARNKGRVRIWSAACSSGQEPYSLAMLILDACPEAASLDLRILATDIDNRILQTAKDGVYSQDHVSGVSPDLLKKYFDTNSKGGRTYRVKQSLKSLVSFGQLNLAKDWPFHGSFDVVFCRNVAIYFDGETQSTLWQRLSKQISHEGLLCIGHSERISSTASKSFAPLGKTAYQRLSLSE